METTAHSLKLYTLGAPQVVLGEDRVKLSRRKTLALLVYLAVTGESHQRAALAALLWPDHDTPRANAYLRQALYELNKALGPGWITADRGQASLAAEAPVWVDTFAFRNYLDTLDKHPHPLSQACEDCLNALETAAALYQGEFLAGFSLPDAPTFDDWQFYQVENHRRSFQQILQLLSNSLEGSGNFQGAIAAANRWLAMDELNEAAHRRLMTLFARSGERSAALQQYQNCVRELENTLGIAPDPETTELYKKILRGEIKTVNDPSEYFPTPEIQPTRRTKTILPAQITTFIGREGDLARIAELILGQECRILTLMGPGGIGKTRLALEAITRLEQGFTDGVHFLSLAHIHTRHDLVKAVGERFGPLFVTQTADQSKTGLVDQLAVVLKDLNTLVVLDNFEQLAAEADVLVVLAQKAPGVKFLITSRVALNLSGEWILEVGGLSFPKSPANDQSELQAYSAVQLFLERAHQAQVGFAPAETAWPAITRITQLVGGMPLALELAASWINVLSLEEITAEIQHGLDLLTTDLQDVPERQRSIRAVFDYSWKLLNPKEQKAAAALAVFQKGFTREAAVKIAGITLPELLGLVKKSLVHRLPENRFDMHPLLQQYALEKLVANPERNQNVHKRYSTYYCQALKSWGEQLATPMQGQAFMQYEAEYENILQAWNWAVKHRQTQLLADAFYAISHAFILQSRFEDGEAAFRDALEAFPLPASFLERRLAAHLMVWFSLFSMMCGHLDQVERILADLDGFLAHPEIDPRTAELVKARALSIQAELLLFSNNYEKAYQLAQQSVELFRRQNQPYEVSNGLMYLSWMSSLMGRSGELDRLREESMEIKRAIGDQFGLASDLSDTALQYAFNQGRILEAIPIFQQSLQILGSLKGRSTLAAVLETSDHLYIIQGNFLKAKDIREKHLQILEANRYEPHIGFCKAQLGEVYHHLGDYARARSYGTQALAHFQGYEGWYNALFSEWFFGLTLLALGENQQAKTLFLKILPAFKGLHARDSRGSTQVGLARAVYALGEFDLAWQYAFEGLENLIAVPHFFWLLYALSSVALVLAHRGQHEKALEVYSMVQQYDFAANSRWFADVYGSPIAALTAHLPPDVRAAAWNRGKMENIHTTSADLLQIYQRQA